jgi:hypothetical protein
LNSHSCDYEDFSLLGCDGNVALQEPAASTFEVCQLYSFIRSTFFHSQLNASSMKVEAALAYEMPMTIKQTTYCHITGDSGKNCEIF